MVWRENANQSAAMERSETIVMLAADSSEVYTSDGNMSEKNFGGGKNFSRQREPRPANLPSQINVDFSPLEGLQTPKPPAIPLLQQRPMDRLGNAIGRKPFEWYHVMTCLVLGLPWAPYSAAYAVFINISASYLRSMHVGDFQAVILPALIPLVLAPVVGAASDRSLAKVGRRTRLLLVALVLTPISGCLFSSASLAFASHRAIIFFSTVGYVVGFLFMQVSLRARMMDVLPIEFQLHAQAALCFWGSIGGLCGMFTLRYHVASITFATEISKHSIFYVFAGILGVLVVVILLTICLRPEHPQETPPYQPPIQQLVEETVDQIRFAPRLFRLLCVVHFVLYFGWLSFQGQIFPWWAENIYHGCKYVNQAAGCSSHDVQEYKHGLETANNSWMYMYGFQALVSLVLLVFLPTRLAELGALVNFFFGALLLSVAALVVAVTVRNHSIMVTQIAFVVAGLYRVVDLVFPYSVVGILCKEVQETRHGFNQNGVYTGVIYVFSSVAELTVTVYGTDQFTKLGSDFRMALPLALFVLSTFSVLAFKTVDI